MNASLPSSTISSAPTGGQSAIPLPIEIDRSCRMPVVFLFTSSVVWLFIGLLLAFLSSIKLHGSGFLASTSWLTYGRIYPAALNVLVYGFATQAGLGLAIWMLARLGRTVMRAPVVATVAGVFWNLGVTLGLFGMLGGHLTGFEWLEMPVSGAPILFFSYVLLGTCALLGLAGRHERVLYVSQWYLLAALLWFPWIYSTAQLLLFASPARGVVQEVVNGWYEQNLFTLWLTPIGLAAVFYFLPKLLGRPLYSQYLAQFSFWTLAVFGGWGALHAGTPVPRWITSLGVVANVFLLIPLMAVAVNWHKTMEGSYRMAANHWALRFILFGGAAYLLAGLLRIAGWLRSVSKITLFTYFGSGVQELFLYGFMMMIVVGAIFYIVPLVAESEWVTEGFRRFYFWAAVAGVVLCAISLIIGGVLQGAAMNDASAPFLRSVRLTAPFVGMNTLGLLLLLIANGALLMHLAKLVCRAAGCCPRTPAPGRNV